LPLAIEMLASWVVMYSRTKDIVKRLNASFYFIGRYRANDDDRHRNMKVVFDHTWQMLTEDEQHTFSMLSVFLGTFSVEAADQVAAATSTILASLVDKCLIRQIKGEHYNLHELLRQYGIEQLEEGSELYKEANDRHCAYFAKFVETHADAISIGKETVFQALRSDLGNIRSAWRYAIRQHKIVELEQFFFGFLFFYEDQGWTLEGSKMFDWGIEQWIGTSASDNIDQLILSQLKLGKAVLKMLQGNFIDAVQLAEQSQPVFERLGYTKYYALSLLVRGLIAVWQGKLDIAPTLLYKALETSKAVDFIYGIGASYLHLGEVSRLQGDYSNAERWYGDSLALARKVDSIRGISISLSRLGALMVLRGDIELAERLYKEGQQVAEAGGDLWVHGDNLCRQAELALAQGKDATAKGYLRTILHSGDELQSHLTTLLAVVTISSRIMAEQNLYERVVEYLTLVIQHPATLYETKQSAELLLDKVSRLLPSSRLSMLQTLGKARTLSDTVNEIRTWLN